MNREFLKLLMDKTGFPAEAKTFLLDSAEKLVSSGQEEALDGTVEHFYEEDFQMGGVVPLIAEMAEGSGLSPHTVWLLFLVEAAVPVKGAFADRGIPEQVFWDTFADLRYKVQECKDVQGVWGNFVAFWYPIFYSCDIVKLGRLEYENCTYEWDVPYEAHGVTLKKGDPVKSIHIPSSGEPFDSAARLASYKKAYEFFREELHGGPLICVCHSWLLYEEYAKILKPGNISDFQKDFDILSSTADKDFGDSWRLFGADYQKPTAELPEKTSMQRAFKKFLLEGREPGMGMGVLVFDGEKLLTRK